MAKIFCPVSLALTAILEIGDLRDNRPWVEAGISLGTLPPDPVGVQAASQY